MSTYRQDLMKANPTFLKDYELTGYQPRWALKNMVKALSSFPLLNTEEDNARLAAAKRILKMEKPV